MGGFSFSGKGGVKGAGGSSSSPTPSTRQMPVEASDPLHKKMKAPSFPGWTEVPEFEVPELAVELMGEPSCGKTHTSGTFPYPAICDTEKKGWMVWGKLGLKKYFHASYWEEVISFWEHIMENTLTSKQQLEEGNDIDPDITVDTIVFDSSRDIREWAELYTKGVTGKKSLYSNAAGPVQYNMVYAKLDTIIQTTRKSGRNVVFTSRLKDQYVKNETTGALIRDGYKKAPYQFDVILRLQLGVYNSKGRQLYPRKIFGRVEKIGWLHASSWPYYLIGNGKGLCYNDIVEELVKSDGTDLGLDDWIEQVVKPKMEELNISP